MDSSSSASVRDRIATLKKELAELTIAQRKVEVERQGLEAQRDSLTNQFTDYSARIASLEESCNSYAAELKALERDKKIEDSAVEGYLKQKAVLDDEADRLKKLVQGAQHRRQTLGQELSGTTEKANDARAEMSKSQEEVAGIINILQVLTENISFTIEQIKGDIQHGNQEALEEASTEFHGYVSDVSEMIATIEKIGLGDLVSFIQNIKTFIENADESVNHIMKRIQENADNAVHSSSEEFDGFMRDLIEIVNNTRITLKKLQVADLGNVYDAVNGIRANLDSQLDSLLENQSVCASKETQLDFLNKEIARRKSVLEEIAAKTKNLLEKTRLKTSIIETTKKNLENVKTQKARIEESLAKLKVDVTARWDRIKDIIDNVGRAQDDLFDMKVAKIMPKMVPLAEVGATEKGSSTIASEVEEESTEPEAVLPAKPIKPAQLKVGTTLLKLGKQPAVKGASSPAPAVAANPPVAAAKVPAAKPPAAASKTPVKKPAAKPTAKPAPATVEGAASEAPQVAKPAVKKAAKPPTAKPSPNPAAGKEDTGSEEVAAPVKAVAKKAAKKPAKKG